MSTTLTDRYTAVTLHRVPTKQRPEIERELRAAIGDDMDARIELGEAPAAAEYAAVKELGSPTLLATRYLGRSGALIGPELYPSYLGTLQTLCWVVLPILAVVLITAARADGANVWASIFPPLGSVLTVAMYMIVVVTVVFAAVDRAGAGATVARGEAPGRRNCCRNRPRRSRATSAKPSRRPSSARPSSRRCSCSARSHPCTTPQVRRCRS